MTSVVELFPGGFAVAIEFDFEIFADVDGADSLVAHVFQGVLHGFALWVQHCLFGRNNYFCFHGQRSKRQWGAFWGKVAQRRGKFATRTKRASSRANQSIE